MNRKTTIHILILTFALHGITHAQEAPSTQPALDYYSGPAEPQFNNLGDGALRLKISSSQDEIRRVDLAGLFNGLSWAPVPAKSYTVFAFTSVRMMSDRSLQAEFTVYSDRSAEGVFEDLYKQSLTVAPAANEELLPNRGGGGRGVFGGGGGGGRRGAANDSYRQGWPNRTAYEAFHEAAQPKFEELRMQTFQRLKTLVTSDPAISPQQRSQRLAELESGIYSLGQKMEVLSQLSKAQPDAAARVAEKLRHLRETEQDLQMKLAAQEARRIALEKGLADLKKQVQSQRMSDARIAYYRAGLDLKMTVYTRKKNAPQGTFNKDEIAEAEAEAKQAQASLLVAEDEAAKGGRGDLMDKLANELTMVSIDTTDLQIQLSQMHDLMSKYDPAALNAQNLDALLAGEPGFGSGKGAKLPPLYYEIQKQRNNLRREQLILLVDDISIITDPPATAP